MRLLLVGLALALAALPAQGGPAPMQLFSLADVDARVRWAARFWPAVRRAAPTSPLAQAVCNDGSSAAYYYAPATSGSASNVWLLMLEGGEWCWDEASCATRKATQASMMGNKFWNHNVAMGGIFETDDTKTPFAGAHKIFVPYCSSDAWVGDTDAAGLAFRGQAIVAAVLQSLVTQQNMGGTDRLLFGGCSAGARGAMFTLDSVAALLARAGAPQVQVQGLLDSPLWIDVAPLATAPLSLQCQTQAAVGFLNATARLGEDCLAAYPAAAEHWRCLFGEYRMQFLRTPYGLNANQYDSFQLEYALGGSMPPIYPNQLVYADSFGEAMRGVVSTLPAAGQADSGVFSGACFQHCVTLTEDFWGLQSEGVSFSDAVRWWYFPGTCPAEDCPGGAVPTQVIEHCDEGFDKCKSKCSLKHSHKGGKRKPRPPKVFTWHAGMATPPAPVVPLACDAGPPVPVLPS
jgi:hypothetical protein